MLKLAQPSGLRFAFALAALTLGFGAQAVMGAGGIRWAIAPYVVAAAAMALAVADRPLVFGVLGRCRTPPGQWSGLEKALGAGGFVLSGALVVSSLALFAGGPPNTLAWYLYGASTVVLVMALPSLDGRWTSLASRLRNHDGFNIPARSAATLAALVLILAFAAALRLYHLQELPAGLWYDEADNLSNARMIADDPGSTPVFVRSTNLPSLFLMPMALVVNLAGVSISAGRLVSVGFSLAGIVAVFLLVRLALGQGMGLLAAFLMAVMRWDINWARIGMHGITAPLFAALTAYLTLRAVRSERVSDFGFAGAALGLGMWFYSSFRLFPLVVGLVLAHYLWSRRPRLLRFLAMLAVMAAVSLAVAAPVVQSAVVDPDDFFARTRTTSVFSLMPFDDAIVAAKDSLAKHALMFGYEGDLNPRHNLPGAPMLDFVSRVLLVLGLGIALTRWRNVALLSLPAWLFLMIMPGVLSLPFEAPQSLRSITVTPAVIALVTLALAGIWWAGRSAPWPVVGRATPVGIALLLAVIAFLNLNTYFGSQASDPRVYAAFSTDETLMARHMVEQRREGYSLLVSRQFLFGLTTSLLAQGPRVRVVRVPDLIPIDPEGVWRGASVYLEPREASFYRLLQAYYPGARFEEVRPPGGGDVMYYSAVISRQQLETPLGLFARYTRADGSTLETIQASGESSWAFLFEPKDAPFDFEWSGTLHVAAPGEYVLALEGEGRAEVALDGTRILGDTTRSAAMELAVGLHSVRVAGRTEGLSDSVRVSWKPPGGDLEPIPLSNLYHGPVRPLGLAGRFYAGGAESVEPDATRVTPALDTFWYDPAIPEPYLAVWTGNLDVSNGGTYGFEVDGAGEIDLWIDGKLRASNVADAAEDAFLTVGAHTIRLEYFSAAPPSRIEVLWEPPGGRLEPIPIERLSPYVDPTAEAN